MSTFLVELRQVARGLLKTPVFTTVVIVTLALGIGANSAIFSIVNSVVLRPLGYPNPGQLMYLTTQFPGLGFEQFWVSPPEYFEFREINQSFSSVGAFTTGEANLTAGDRPVRVRSASVDERLIAALGVQPVQGRAFAAGETDITGPPPVPGQPPPLPPAVVMLSHELWRSAFSGAPVVGSRVEVNGVPREVIGIMPPGADVMDNRTEIWMPIGLNPANRQNRGNHFLYLIGRLKDGVTIDAARTELTSLIANWGERVGVQNHVYQPNAHILQMHQLQEQILGTASRSIWVLQVAVGLVLLVACANLGNLLLARAETRRRELAVRTALGASRGQLLRQFVMEGVMLSVIGGLVGLVFADVAMQALLRAYPGSLPRTSEVNVDPLVLLFTFAVAVATGVLFGFAPALHTRMQGLATTLKEGSARGATKGARHHVRRGLVMAEVALAVMLVIGAGLLVRTVSNLANVDAGFDRARLVTFSITLPAVNYPQPTARAQVFHRLLDRLVVIPGVQSATAMSGLPPNRPLNANDTEIDNYTPTPEGPAENVDYYQGVMADYFETMGIPIVAGRGFEPADAASTGFVTVVNETLVNRFWKDQNPIGQRLRPCCSDAVPWFTVVGVAKDVKQGGIDRSTGTEFYRFIEQTAGAPPIAAYAPNAMNVVLRTTLSPAALSNTITTLVRDVDASVPVVRLREMEAVFAETMQRPRLLAQLLGGFAGLALLLAALGTYGVLAGMVAERRREIGIRIALGATWSRVVGDVMSHGLLLTGMGLIVGLAGALALTRLMTSLLFGVRPTDPLTLVTVVGTIAIVAALACGLPAWRASRVDPIVVLRDD